jgi:predicted DNA-binding transcriptional regulator AlpA
MAEYIQTNQKNKICSGYWDTTDLIKRFKISKMTLWRWMNREVNPLPKPIFYGSGSKNKWAIDDIINWENSIRNEA